MREFQVDPSHPQSYAGKPTRFMQGETAETPRPEGDAGFLD
jgi:hypothetical protein